MTDMIKDAAQAVVHAQKTRKKHALKSPLDSEQRLADLGEALALLKKAMAPLRSAAGRYPFEAQTDIAEKRRAGIKLASEAIQKERVKLWKMQNASKKAQNRG